MSGHHTDASEESSKFELDTEGMETGKLPLKNVWSNLVKKAS